MCVFELRIEFVGFTTGLDIIRYLAILIYRFVCMRVCAHAHMCEKDRNRLYKII